MRIPAKAILPLLDLLHTYAEIGHFPREAAKALYEFGDHVDTKALVLMAEEHSELEIRPR